MVEMDLTDLAKFFTELPSKLEDNIPSKMVEIGHELEGNLVKNAPIDTGRLRGSFTSDRPRKRGNTFSMSTGTNVEYAPFVNSGHKTRLGKGKKQSKKAKGESFIPGTHFLEKSVAQLERDLPDHVQDLIETTIRGAHR